jgi:hypothetical protein
LRRAASGPPPRTAVLLGIQIVDVDVDVVVHVDDYVHVDDHVHVTMR